MNKQHDTRLLAKLGTLRQLEIFLKVAEVGGIAQAAQQLHLTQPSVSIQVRKLAEAVGLPLYEVIGRRLKLTEAGRRVEAAGREIVDTLNRLDSAVNDLKGLQAGTLKIAVDSSAKYFIPQLLGPFSQRHPGVELEFKEGKRSYLLDRLRNNLDDLYFFSDVPPDMDITHYPFLPNPLVVVAPRDHPLAQRSKLSWEDIADERFILRSIGSGSRYAIDEFLADKGWQINRITAMESGEAIRLSVMARMGISILSAYALVNADAEGLVQLPVRGFPIMTQWHVVHLRQKPLSHVAQAFLDFIQQESEQYLPMDKIELRLQQAMQD
jgi:LysR family transcriptional regulator, low CO2-responsive transcriptional regulator